MNKPTMADRVIGAGSTAGVVVVDAIAAVASYRHAYEYVLKHGETGWIAAALPVTVDGMIATCSAVIYDAAKRDERAPLAWVGLIAGMVATLAANIAHGVQYGPGGIAVSAWVAFAAVLTFEVLMGKIRRRARQPEPAPVPAPVVELVEPEPAPEPALEPAAVAAAPPEPEPEPVPPVPPVPPTPAPVIDPELWERALAEFGDEVRNAGRTPGVPRIKEAFKIGQPKAQQIRDGLRVLVETT